MELIKTRALRGPNLWTRHTAIEALVQCLPEQADIALMPSFEERLRRRLVVVPTREAGLRLRETLLAVLGGGGAAAMLGPRLAAPEDFFRPAAPLPESAIRAGWLRVLEETPDAAVAELFPSGIGRQDREWRLAVARQIEDARDVGLHVGAGAHGAAGASSSR